MIRKHPLDLHRRHVTRLDREVVHAARPTPGVRQEDQSVYTVDTVLTWPVKHPLHPHRRHVTRLGRVVVHTVRPTPGVQRHDQSVYGHWMLT